MTRRPRLRQKADIPGSMLSKRQKTISRVCKRKGQAVLELAIFGGIIIFVVGLIFNQAMSGSYTMNANLKAMRTALTESYKFSEQKLASRRSAAVTIVEDRLAGDLGRKFGPIDRTPVISVGSATMSKLLFYPVDYGETNAIPVMDVLINGQRFPLITGGWKTVNLPTSYDPSIIRLCTGPHPDGQCWDPSCNAVVILSPVLEICDNVDAWGVPIDEPGTAPEVNCADPTCNGYWACPGGADGEFSGGGLLSLGCSNGVDDDGDGFIDCNDRECMLNYECRTLGEGGCVRVYQFVENAPGSGFNAANASYFDLDFDLIPDVPLADRATFAWQWQPVNALYPGADGAINLNTTLTLESSINVDGGVDLLPNGDRQTEVVKAISGCDQSAFDRDFEECVSRGDGAGNSGGNCYLLSCAGERITQLHVLDSQEGDIDNTRDDSSSPPDPGLLDDAQMFSYTRDGTLFRIEEGELFNLADGRFVRHTNRMDHYDIIQRIFRVSNDTNRFCSAGGSPQGSVDGLPNPVEACADCFGANVERTCMDPAARLIYIRSRISNLGGRRWVTRKAPP